MRKNLTTETNYIKGGKSDNMSIKDIANKFKVGISKIEAELRKGKKIELEHTNNQTKATEIAMDHLIEFPDYYTRLEKLEKEAQRHWKNKVANENTKDLIKRLIRENFDIKQNVLDIQEPFDSIKKININGKNVYSLFGDVDYYQNKESILALKRKSNTVKINENNYKEFLLEAKNRFNTISELKNVKLLASIETTAPVTDEFSKILNLPYKKHGFLKKDTNFKMKDVQLDKRSEIKQLFNLNFDISNNDSICVLDDFITTGTSFKHAFSLLPNDIHSVGVCLFILKS